MNAPRFPVFAVALALALGLAATLTPPARAAEREVSLADAILLALKQNHQTGAAEATVEAENFAERAARGRYGPVLKLEANLLFWNDAQTFSLGGSSGGGAPQLPPPATPYEQALAGLLQGFGEPTEVRGQITSDIKLTLAQPLTPLYTISKAAAIQEAGREAVELQRDRTQQNVAAQAATAYFRVLQAQALAEVAGQSVAQLQAQFNRVDSLARAGVARENDRLRIEVAVASARQEALRAHSQAEIATDAFALALGAPAGQRFVPAGLVSAGLPAVNLAAEAAVDRALKQRPDLAELAARSRQAELGRDAATGALIPSLNAVATYAHSEGNGFAAKDSFFAGAVLDWTIFEWGATYYKRDEAGARARQLEFAAAQARDGIAFEVKKAWREFNLAREALAVAEKAVAQAAESHRLETVRYEAGASPAIELLDAEAALLKIRQQRIIAYYECLAAHTALRAAMGEKLTADLLLTGG